MSVPNWQHIGLVVFDVDGTLYNQRALRSRMALELCKHSIGARELKTLRVLQEYRRKREELAQAEISRFEHSLNLHVSSRFGLPQPEISRIVEEWLELRPLPFLLDVRRPGIANVFSELKRTGRNVAVLSDYPTERKMTALKLKPDIQLYAGDPRLEVMKPNSKGLRLLMEQAGYLPGETLMVGDRDDRDGEVARREGVASMILNHWNSTKKTDTDLVNLSRSLGLSSAAS